MLCKRWNELVSCLYLLLTGEFRGMSRKTPLLSPFIDTDWLALLTARPSMMDARRHISRHLLAPQLLVDPLEVLVVSGIADNQDWSLEEVEVNGAPWNESDDSEHQAVKLFPSTYTTSEWRTVWWWFSATRPPVERRSRPSTHEG